jgi:putative DNA primase/helicase
MAANLDVIPIDLKDRKQWCDYKLEIVKDKKTKVPYQINSKRASSTDLKTWTTFSIARNAYENLDGFDGMCFMLSKDNGITFIDLDHSVKDEVVEPWADEIVKRFNSYTEISQSGKGLHILIKASKPGDRCRTSKCPHDIEIYDNARQCCLTGDTINGLGTIEARQEELNKFYLEIFGEQIDEKKRFAEFKSNSKANRDFHADTSRMVCWLTFSLNLLHGA